jgi:succinate-acetate transporter protein
MLRDYGKLSDLFCENNEMMAPCWQMYILWKVIENTHYNENNKIQLTLQPKNNSVFNIITLTVHKNSCKMDLLLQAVLITLGFYYILLAIHYIYPN